MFRRRSSVDEFNLRMSHEELTKLPHPNSNTNNIRTEHHQIDKHLEDDEQQQQQSKIANFYHDRSVLVTGASGFVGKLLIEKLLRACPSIRRIYLLIRSRRDKTPEQRLDDLLRSIAFDGIRDKLNGPELLRNKLIVLNGNLTEKCLGLDNEIIEKLANDVSVILHSAALVSFDGKFRRSIQTNLTGTFNVLQVACRLPKLVSLVHVSTCYSNCALREIDELIYKPNIDPKCIIDLADSFDVEMVELLRAQLIGQHPNPYTYTKQLAEYLCAQYAINNKYIAATATTTTTTTTTNCENIKCLPVLICRPSIVIGTYREPLPGYLDNRNAANGLYDGLCRGTLRVLNGSGAALIDQVPADMVANSIITLGWFASLYYRARQEVEMTSGGNNDKDERNHSKKEQQVSSQKHTDSNLQDHIKMIRFYQERKDKLVRKGVDEKLAQVPVVNVSSGVENPISYGQMMENVRQFAVQYPSIRLFRSPRVYMITNYYLCFLCSLFYHKLTGRFIDFLSNFSGPHSTNWSIEFGRMQKFIDVLDYFLLNTWYFNPDNRLNIWNNFMTQEDRRLFNFDMKSIDWCELSHDMTRGIRKYLLGESDDNLLRSRAKYRLTSWRNASFKLIFAIIAFCVVKKLFF